MYWDGDAEPAVEAPVGDFFGAGFGLRRELKSVPVQVETGDGYNCYWPMPFFKRGVITITNESQKNIRSFYYHIDYTEEEKLSQKTAYFCAQYKNEFPEKTGSDYLILDAEGEGHYVGTVMSARSRSPFWFGEGDVKFYVDGDEKPTIRGTGTEDYFLMAWGLNETNFPYFGCTYMSTDFEDLGTEYCLYRWHIADPVRFTKSLRFEIEHKGWISDDETESGKVFFMLASDSPVLEVDFQVEREEYRGLILRFTYAEDYGIYRIFLDGKNVRQPADYLAGQKIADYDCYSKDLQVKDNYLGSFKLAPGKHTLRLECVGKNPLSKGNYVGLDSIRLRERWIKKRKLLS